MRRRCCSTCSATPSGPPSRSPTAWQTGATSNGIWPKPAATGFPGSRTCYVSAYGAQPPVATPNGPCPSRASKKFLASPVPQPLRHHSSPLVATGRPGHQRSASIPVPFLRCPAGARSHSARVPGAASAGADLPPANFLWSPSGTGTRRLRTDPVKPPAPEWRSQVVRLRLRRSVYIVSLWAARQFPLHRHGLESANGPLHFSDVMAPCRAVSVLGFSARRRRQRAAPPRRPAAQYFPQVPLPIRRCRGCLLVIASRTGRSYRQSVRRGLAGETCCGP